MGNDLTPRQRAFLRAYAEGASNKDAAVLAGYSAKYNPLQRMKYQEYLDRLMDQVGLSEERLLEAILEGLEAYDVKVDPSGTEHRVPDFHARHKFVETALKLRAMFPPARLESTVREEKPVVVRVTPSLDEVEPPEDIPSLPEGEPEDAADAGSG